MNQDVSPRQTPPISPAPASLRNSECSLFEHLFRSRFPKSRPRWLCLPNGTQLELDGYCARRHLAFEYHGQQHYEFTPVFHDSNEKFRRRRSYDRAKMRLCAAQGVTLLEVP